MGFIASYIHQLENSGLLSHVDVPTVDTSHYTTPNMQYQKTVLVNITTDVPEKPLLGSCQAHYGASFLNSSALYLKA